MKMLKLLVTLFIALWLHHMVSIAAQMKHLMVDYREICKVKKTITADSHSQNIFSKETFEILQLQSDEIGFQKDHRSKNYTVAKDEWDKLQKEHVLPLVNSKFFPKYGVLFNNHGYLLPSLKKTYLFVAVEIPKERHIKRIELDLPDCDEWAGRNLHNWQGTQRNVPAIKELIHQQFCADVNRQFQEFKADIDDEWQVPAFVPNNILHTAYGDAVKLPNGKLWYSQHKP